MTTRGGNHNGRPQRRRERTPPDETETPFAEVTQTTSPDETETPSPSPTEPPTAAAVPPPIQSPSPTPTPSPALLDDVVKKVRVGARPKAPTYLRTNFPKVRTGAVCRDGSHSDATGRGACSWHGGVRRWTLGDSHKATENKWTNSARKTKYKAALKRWNARKAHNAVLAKYPCSKGPYKEGSAGYRSWRDTNDDGLACA